MSRPGEPVPAADFSGPGLYLHLPFCSEICPYCDFAVVKAGRERRYEFVDALLAEIGLAAQLGRGFPLFDTVYLGGGTPSLLEPEALRRIVGGITRLGIAPGAWLLLEANPEDVAAESVAAWRELGVRTLSLGVQSFDDGALAFLGRRHRAREAAAAVERARSAGIDTVSIDLIYGLPKQTPAAWRRDLERAVALAPDHLSCYQLTVHAGTPFGVRRDRGTLAELPKPDQAALFELTHRFLADAGYPAYEVSSFASAPRHRSRHNVKYWRHTPYLGLGPSAHSFDGADRRWWNERRLGAWQRRVGAGELPVEGEERLGRVQLALEALMLGLRTPSGVDPVELEARYGVAVAEPNRIRVERWAAEGRLELEGGRWRPTLAGLAVADSLAAAIEIGEPVSRSGRRRSRGR